MPLSLSELKASEPKRYCSECDKTKPISQFPTSNHGLKSRPSKICNECAKKHKQPKIEAEILGVSESKPLLKDLNHVKEAINVYEDEDEPRTKECAECREFKELDEFDSSDKICEDCWEDLQRQHRLVDEKVLKKEVSKEPEYKECPQCGERWKIGHFNIDKNICSKCDRRNKREAKEVKAKKPTEKTCIKCEKTKPCTEFHRDRSYADNRSKTCKECTKEATQLRDETKAREVFKKDVLPFSANQKIFRVVDIWEKISHSKKGAYTIMAVMVSIGLLKVTRKGVTNWYEVVVDSEPERTMKEGGQQADIVTVDDPQRDWMEYESKIKMLEGELEDLEIKYHKSKKWNREDRRTIADLQKQIGDMKTESKVEVDPTSMALEAMNFREILSKKVDVNTIKMKKKVTDIVDNVYDNAETISISPQSDEIKIKLKG